MLIKAVWRILSWINPGISWHVTVIRVLKPSGPSVDKKLTSQRMNKEFHQLKGWGIFLDVNPYRLPPWKPNISPWKNDGCFRCISYWKFLPLKRGHVSFPGCYTHLQHLTNYQMTTCRFILVRIISILCGRFTVRFHCGHSKNQWDSFFFPLVLDCHKTIHGETTRNHRPMKSGPKGSTGKHVPLWNKHIP